MIQEKVDKILERVLDKDDKNVFVSGGGWFNRKGETIYQLTIIEKDSD